MRTISIVIPVYNERETIERLLAYLEEHASKEVLEILVIDGCSTDGTKELIKGPKVRLICCEKSNRAVQMNLGAKEAKGEILYFIHADCFPPDTYSSDILGAIDQGYDMGCYRSRLESPPWFLRVNSYFTRFKWLFVRGGDQTFFIPRELFLELGGYDEQYCIMEEYAFLQKYWKQYKFRIFPKSVIISNRKYHNRSWYKVNKANLIAVRNFRKGVDPEIIMKEYKSMLE